jgi:hypothetical protein
VGHNCGARVDHRTGFAVRMAVDHDSIAPAEGRKWMRAGNNLAYSGGPQRRRAANSSPCIRRASSSE